MNPATKVFDEDDTEVQAGSEDGIGTVAAGGMIPLGYYKDPEKDSPGVAVRLRWRLALDSSMAPSASRTLVGNPSRHSFSTVMMQVPSEGT